MTFMSGAMNIVQSLYAKYFGLSLAAIASILLLSRIFDAITDPLIGYWSDRYQRRRGTRHAAAADGDAVAEQPLQRRAPRRRYEARRRCCWWVVGK